MPKFVISVMNQDLVSQHPDAKIRAHCFRVGDVISVIPEEKYLSKWNFPYITNVIVEAASIDDLTYLMARHGYDEANPLPKMMVRLDLAEMEKDAETTVKTDQKMGDMVDVPSLEVCEKYRKVAVLSKKDTDDIAAEETVKLGGG